MTVQQPSRSVRVFDFLVVKATAGQTTTYQEIALTCDLPNQGNHMSRVLSEILGNIFRWCVIKDLPHLTSIVVRKSGSEQGLPGKGFWQFVQHVAALGFGDPSEIASVYNAPRYKKANWAGAYQAAVFQLKLEDWLKAKKDNFMLERCDDDQTNLEDTMLTKLGIEPGKANPVKEVKEVRAHEPADYTPASLSHEQVDAALEQMRKRMASVFGVTLVQDHNGAWGMAGARHVTLRFGDFNVSLQVTQVTSHTADAQQAAWEREDK